ncbi:type 1 fimbrial protein [Escherichia coli]|nr:type 1 fimbrial protein [Escherichia coli]
MKLKHVGMIVVSVLAMSSAAVSAAEGDESVTTTVNGGVIHFKGEVVNAACAIDSESMNQTVELGQVRSSRLAKAGDLSSAVGFNIKLNDCDTNASGWHNITLSLTDCPVETSAVTAIVTGSTDNTGYYKNEGTAENIQIELRDDQDAALKNGDSKTVIVDEITRNAQFPLKARAITVNGNASQGTIEALINVIYTWQ